LNIGSRSFDVKPLGVNKDGEWTDYDPNNKRAAYWAAGTLVNYVIGLHASTDNRTLYDSVLPNDLISVDSAIGPQRYRVVSKTKIKADDVSLLADQSSPRLTLVMLGESGDERNVIVAQYTDEGTPNTPVAINTPVNLGDVRVSASETILVPGGRVGLAEGRNLYQVNIRVTNIVTRILDAAQFYTELQDGQGNKYQLSVPGAAASGGKGWAKGALAPEQSIEITAAFEVPNAMQGPYLQWRFATDAQNPYVAVVALPYRPIFVEPTVQPTSAPRTRLDVSDVVITPEGTEIKIVGKIANLTSATLKIGQTDMAFKTADGAQSPLNAYVPELTWEIPAGEELVFSVTFAKPATLPATFTLLDQSVQIADR
jgi:hypothetical protein